MKMSEAYSVLLSLSSAVALGAIAYAWQRRRTSPGLTMIIMLFAMLVWSWTYAMHWQFPAWPSPQFWLDSTYFGAVSISPIAFIFAIQISLPNYKIQKKHILELSVIPLLTLFLLWTDPYHHLFFGSPRSLTASTIYSGGPGFWMNLIYSYCLLVVAIGLFISTFIHSDATVYRGQLVFCILGMIFPVIASIFGLIHFEPLPGLDLVPISFIVTGLFFILSLRVYHLLDITPVAYNVLLDQMVDGIIFLDTQNRILDANKVAVHFLKTSKSSLIGRSIRQFEWLSQKISNVPGKSSLPINFAFSMPEGPAYDIQITPLLSGNNSGIGHLIVWRDVTHLKKIEDKLRLANDTLTMQLKQIEALQKTLMEQSIRDPLTQLFNRRFLENVLPKEIARSQRNNRSLSFLVLDIDFFKQVNDRFGHEVGDDILVKIASKIETNTRTGDWVVRYGGEEFLIVLVDSDLKNAELKAEEIRSEIENVEFEHHGIPFKVTVSIGIAEYHNEVKDWHIVFNSADEAMYQAKAAGRNCVRANKTKYVLNQWRNLKPG